MPSVVVVALMMLEAGGDQEAPSSRRFLRCRQQVRERGVQALVGEEEEEE